MSFRYTSFISPSIHKYRHLIYPQILGCLVGVAQAEVYDFDVLLLIEQEILRFQVTMDHIHPQLKHRTPRLKHEGGGNVDNYFSIAS